MKVQYLLTFPQIRAIKLLAHIDGKFLSGEVNDRRLVEYDITTDQNFMLDSLLGQKGFIVKDKPLWPSYGDEYYYIDNDGAILKSYWDTTNDGTVLTAKSRLDAHRRDISNIFKTREAAEFELERLKVLNQLKSLSDDWKELNSEEPHYYIVYDSDNDEFDTWKNYIIKLPHEYCFKSEELAEAAIKIIGKDKLKKYVFNIKE